MNFQALIYFKVLSELKHYTNAANQLCITQPALTKSIQTLEHELGVPLFKKDGRSVVLTKYGKLFYPYVTKAILNITLGTTALNHLIETEDNVIVMSCLHSMYSFFLTENALYFKEHHPNCKFAIEYKFTSAVLRDVIEGHCELGICSEFDNTGKYKALQYITIYKEPICFIVGKGHPLARKKQLVLKDICTTSFITYFRSDLGTNKLYYDLCKKCNVDYHDIQEGFNDLGVLNLVSMNKGIAIVPDSGYLNLDNVVKITACECLPQYRNINVVWRRNRHLSNIVVEFRKQLQNNTISHK